jgi:ferredoxin-NADP reductase
MNAMLGRAVVIGRLDALLGRVTMYRLILLLLATIAAAALALSTVGIVPFSPLALTLSLLVSVSSTVVATWAGALIVRSKPHLESMLITGFILFFLFLPGTDARSLGSLALAGLVAGLSKYLIVVRGRHLVNPAAAGALTVSALQLGAVGWWVATPVLLPLTLIGAFLILSRMKRLAVGGLFVLIATTLIVGRLVAFGQDPRDAVGTALGSYAIIFLVGFMLTEPLTSPPRRWQQFAVASIVGTLFAVPFSIPLGFGVLYSSPELALVVGNLIAFAFGQRRGVNLTLVSKKQLTDRTWELEFQPDHSLRFSAGQYLELTIPHERPDHRGSRRYFSISSAPGDGVRNPPLTIAFTVSVPSSSFKTHLLALGDGARVRATGVGGDFLLPRRRSTPIALIAGGIGITPFASQLAAAQAQDRAQTRARAHDDCVLIYSLNEANRIPYADVLRGSGARVVLVAPEAPKQLPVGWEYAGAGPLNLELLRELIPDIASRRVYISGPPHLVSSIRLSARTLRARNIATDHFSGY